jgi:hypothetical protein
MSMARHVADPASQRDVTRSPSGDVTSRHALDPKIDYVWQRFLEKT